MVAKQHFDEIDIVKGIAISFVLWHHSFIKFPIYMLDIPWCKYAMAIKIIKRISVVKTMVGM